MFIKLIHECQRKIIASLALAGSYLSHKAVVLLHMPTAITASGKITNVMTLILINRKDVCKQKGGDMLGVVQPSGQKGCFRTIVGLAF